MSTDAYPSLPTLQKLGATIPDDLDAHKVAAEWFKFFASYAESGNVEGILGLFVEQSFWRDVLALTWDFRTFEGTVNIKQFLTDCLASSHMKAFKLKDDFLGLYRPYPDLAWIQALFEFETDVGIGSGIFRLVPVADGSWKAHCVFTNLEDLKDFPEKIGPLRNPAPNHGKWASQRRKETAFEDSEPTVLIVGGGQSGLELAARLKCLDISSLIVEKNPRIGDNWRNRYDALCLHDPVWYDHMPYIPFPPTWPVFTPALKLANWLESYAESLELNVWTSSTVESASQDADSNWSVTVKRPNGEDRIFKPRHLVFATGLGGGSPKLPSYPGMDKFKGQILHSLWHKKATDHAGKKVAVVGSCTSAHDISVDYADNGVDVTMVQRSSTYIMSTKNGFKVLMEGLFEENAPPTAIADRINASFPNHLMGGGLAQRQVARIAEQDKPILDGLTKRGFRINKGYKDAGFLLLAWERAGGYYLDVGGSQYIIDGKIKLKNDSQIQEFTETGIKFENGSELPADVVIFSTGLGDARDPVRKVCGDEIGDKCKRIWGLNKEGELNGAWRDLGVPRLWYMMGNLAMCRFYSKHVALQIKAMEEGVFGTRYELEE